MFRIGNDLVALVTDTACDLLDEQLAQYDKAGVDDRLRKIIKERIDGVISGISTIAVTADSGIMDAIESLGERLDTMADMTALESDLDAIIRKINGTNA